jgi:hypothetical protein
MWLATFALGAGLVVGQASTGASPVVPHPTGPFHPPPQQSVIPAGRVPVARAAAKDADRHAHSPDELMRNLARIERAANLVQQHQTDTTAESMAAARLARAMADELARRSESRLEAARLVHAVDAMALASRRGYSPQEIRARALEVLYEVHRYYDLRAIPPPAAPTEEK